MKTKKEFRYFTIFNHEAEEKYLSGRHREGWRFTGVSGLGMYHFESCEPEDVVYQLDYNEEGTKNRDEYVTMFADCGWEYLQEYAGYSYFRKRASEMNGEETIFSDNSSRNAMMMRVFKARLTPLLVIFCASLLPMFILQMSNSNYVIAAFLGGILVVYVVMFAAVAIKMYKIKSDENDK